MQGDWFFLARFLFGNGVEVDRDQQIGAEQLNEITFKLDCIGAQDANQACATVALQ